MATYTYEALDLDGRRSEGTVVATSRRQALEQLVAGGQNVLDLREAAKRQPGAGPVFRFRKRLIRLSAVTRQLATLLGAGVPLVQSLDVLIAQTTEPRARQVLTDIRQSVQGGSTLAEALEGHAEVFPQVMASMVRAGERGGILDQVLSHLAELFDKEESLKGEVRAAMAYPTLVLFLGLASTVALVGLLIPRLEPLFEGVGQALPAPTRLLLAISHFVTGYGWVLALVVVGAFAGLRLALRYPGVRLFVDSLKLQIPWTGRLIRDVAIARFARLVGTLARGGITVVEGLDIAGPALGNALISRTVVDMARRIRGGESLASLMRESGVFPPLPVQMVSVGEESGRLGETLMHVAEAYEREAATSTRVMTSLLAPVMILLVAGLVGFVILSMVLPIFQLSSVLT